MFERQLELCTVLAREDLIFAHAAISMRRRPLLNLRGKYAEDSTESSAEAMLAARYNLHCL